MENDILKDILAGKQNLPQMIEYANDAVVSKTLINKTAGTLTLFAFDKGQSLSTHSAPYDATVLVIDGSVEISIADKIQKLNAGDLIVMPANVPHGLRALDKFKMLLIMIKENNV